jgi:Fe-S-cluster containining protein
VTTTRVLSLHAAYGCRERGACCTAGWPIPIEADALARAERAIAAGSIDVPASVRMIFVRPADAPAETPALLATHDDRCVFHARSGTTRCSLHRALGHAALPLACRQFPRISVVDPRGVSITLSHYCPTAAGLLEAAAPLRIVEGAAGFPMDGEYVGLDVRDALPPALRSDMLMDWESWWQWESESVALLGSQTDPREALARLFVAVEHVRKWSPGNGPLTARVMSAFEAARTPDHPPVALRVFEVVAAGVLATVPTEFQPQAEAALGRRTATTASRVHIAFLAAHAFANWTAHLGDDLRGWWRSIEAAHILLGGGLSVRDVDLLLRHLATGTTGTTGTTGDRRLRDIHFSRKQ